MKIDCYLSEHCGSFHALRVNLDQALHELTLEAEVAFHTIYYDDAVTMDIKGSPTVCVDGRDLFPIDSTPGIT
jgi:hypothetical protein